MTDSTPDKVAEKLADMRCTEKDCLATIAWFTYPADPALANLARQRGWVHTEGSGWLCPHHARSRGVSRP